MDRRTITLVLASAAASGLVGCVTGGGSGGRKPTVFYQSVGDQLTHWHVDVDQAALTRRASITLPSNVQYVWPHPSRPYLYVSTSDAASGNAPNPGKVHRCARCAWILRAHSCCMATRDGCRNGRSTTAWMP